MKKKIVKVVIVTPLRETANGHSGERERCAKLKKEI